jgi:hypothetical protein
MDSKRVNAIITEAINKVINEDFMSEFATNKPHHHNHSDAQDLVQKYFGHTKHHKDGDNKDNAPKKKLRRKAGGGKEYYNYDDYEKKNRKVSKGDANSIRTTIDTEKTNMAAVARELFPDHTEEGAQSQFRKIINGERPMTKNIASKVEKMISLGQIAVK